MTQFIRPMIAVAASIALSAGAAAAAQPPGEPTANPGGTVALEGTMTSFYKGLNTIIVTTIDGVEHALTFTKDLIVHGGKRPGPDALEDLRKGSPVVVHFSVSGATETAAEIDEVGDNLHVTEGSVLHVDRRRQTVTVRYANGKTDRFQLTSRAAAEGAADLAAAGATPTKVTIYFSDIQGKRIVYYFKKIQ